MASENRHISLEIPGTHLIFRQEIMWNLQSHKMYTTADIIAGHGQVHEYKMNRWFMFGKISHACKLSVEEAA